MIQQDFQFLIGQFGVPIYLNDETKERQVILSSQTQSDTLPNFDDKTIHCSFEISRGDVITYDNVQYLVISDVQSKQLYEYKATIRPMTNTFNFTYMTEGVIIDYDQYMNPIYKEGEEPQEVTKELPCIAYQEGIPSMTSGFLIMPEARAEVIMPDNYATQQIEMNTEHRVLNNTYVIIDINLFQAGLRKFVLVWRATYDEYNENNNN